MSQKEIKQFSDVMVLKREVYESELGYFTNLYNQNLIECDFIQDSVSHINKTGTVKGLHFQNSPWLTSQLIDPQNGQKPAQPYSTITINAMNTNSEKLQILIQLI